MKGMQKIKRGKAFNGLISYLLKPASHHKSDPYVVGGNVIESFAEALSAEFNATKLLRSDVSKPVWHNSLRLPVGENLPMQKWKQIADDYMKRMGFSETHLRAYVLHDDKDGQHIHIVASRIDATSGKLYLGKNENLISTRIIQELEKDYQLTRTKGTDAMKPSSSPAKRKKSRNEAMLEDRTGEKCPKTIIQEAIDTLITSKISEDEFVQQLAAQKIKAIPNRASTGKMNGFSFEYANISFKASQLGKKYSWKNLEPFIIIAPLAVDDRKASIAFNATNPEEIIRIVKADSVSFFGGIDAENTLLPLSVLPVVDDIYQEKVKTTGKSYVDVAMRWIETIPFIDTIVITLKKLRNPLLRAFKQPPKIFSASLLHIELPCLPSVEKSVKTNIFRLKI
ncbi:TPA: relaxase/mobilization nuclease domain-containing protein [Escherichia coli]|uniref:relaxase/mobilization nuclease domain-containing protein n=1 Tax=Enterobacteriaceae TaxID=543 RepID=UPI00098BF465|nr:MULTISPECIES: relaxase/mobilization nuclease domain-containing protein [Enterobacteriaceae]EES4206835.1 relaxase/mobilization nuclease domain-containing protein [Escherichia coli]EET8565293.1 relaxase/mobilization nuclease domain-containing protein [Escherichia coli]EEW1861389.1 relaxase [Escherichia coli]EFA5346701.1 relaxase [Escherichia coli]EFG5612429.1 relaxase/mobilization nuclease domain-containing protein [Escherichia coli]